MENATKALLIAGSILIAIILIAVGVRIFNSGDETANSVESTLGGREVSNFNNKFKPYEGNSKSGKQVKELINLVRVSNTTNNEYSKIVIAFKGIQYYSEAMTTESDRHFSKLYNVISDDKKYNVIFTYYNYEAHKDSDRKPKYEGLLHKITVREME